GWAVVVVAATTGEGATFVVAAVTAFVPRGFIAETRLFVAPTGLGTGGNHTLTRYCHRKSAPKDATNKRTVFRSMKFRATQSRIESECSGASRSAARKTSGTGSQPHGPHG